MPSPAEKANPLDTNKPTGPSCTAHDPEVSCLDACMASDLTQFLLDFQNQNRLPTKQPTRASRVLTQHSLPYNKLKTNFPDGSGRAKTGRD